MTEETQLKTYQNFFFKAKAELKIDLNTGPMPFRQRPLVQENDYKLVCLLKMDPDTLILSDGISGF